MSASNYQPGQVLTAAALNASFDGKTDNESAAITGGTITGIETLEVSGTEDSTSPTTGAVVVAGGVGIALDVQVGGGVTVAGETIVNSTQVSSSTTTGALVVAGGAGIGGNVNVGGAVNVTGALAAAGVISANDTVDSTNLATGAIVVAGGAAISKTLNVGGAANVTGALSVTGATNLTGALAVTTINVQAAGTINLATGASIVFPDGSTQTSAGGNSEVAISTTGGTTIINATQSNGNIFKVTGALTSNAILVFPASAKAFIVDNATTGAFSLTIEANGQSPSVVVPQGKAVSVFTDSTGAYAAGSTGSGIGFTSIVNPNANIALTAQQAGAYVMQQTAGTTTSLPQASTVQAGQGFLFKDVVGGSILSLAHAGDNGDLAFPFTCTQGDEYLLISDGVSHWYVALHTNNVWVQVTGGIIFPDGTQQTTANGTTAPTSTVYSIANANVTLGASTIVTSGYIAPFVVIYRNGIKLINGIDWTYAGDGRTVNLTVPVGKNDQFEILTNVIQTPSSAITPNSQYFTPIAGATSITVSYNVGFVFVYQNGSRLVPGIDFTATNGTSITFNGFAASGSDTFEVWILTPVTLANMLSSSNPTMVGGALTFPDGSKQGSGAPGKNRIINGACTIAQRAGATWTAGTGGYAAADRFMTSNQASGSVVQQVATLSYNGVTYNCINLVATVASGSVAGSAWLYGIAQSIEGFNSFDLKGKQVTVSFVFQASVAGTFPVTLRDGTASYSCVQTFNYTTPNVAQYFTVTFPAIPAAATVPISNATGLTLSIAAVNTGAYQASSSGAWVAGNFLTAPGCTNWAASTNGNIAVTLLQLEAGSTATPFEERLFAYELEQCQRYYQTMYVHYNGYQAASNNIAYGVDWAVQMRTTPSVTFSGGSYSNASGITAVNPNPIGGRISALTTATGPTAFNDWLMTLSAEL